MRSWLGIRMALRALGAHKVRTALTLLGMVAGVAAVVAMVAIGQGTQAVVLRTIERMGTNLLIVQAGQVKRVAGRQSTAGATVTTLTERDALAIIEECAQVAAAAPAQSKKLPVTYDDQRVTTSIIGTIPAFQQVRDWWPAQGEFFSEEQVRGTARVAVLGQTVAQQLFGTNDPVGESVRINRVPFTIIGVLQAKGMDIDGQDQDDLLLIPISTALRRLLNQNHLTTIYVSVREPDQLDTAAADIAHLLRERHRLHPETLDDFTIQNQAALLEAHTATSGTFTLLIGSIGGISLLVGGIGILAVMLIAVRERTREIGLRRAVGARRTDILMQFLLETVVLSLLGGAVGVLLGIAGAQTVSLVTGWPMRIPWSVAGLAIVFSLVLGVLFGVYPARKAAALDPIVALRSE